MVKYDETIDETIGCIDGFQACVQLGKWDVALKLLGTMERDGTQLAAWWRLKL